MQIFLNGQELDLNVGEKVAITLQLNDLGDLSKANTSYTNKFKIPKTPKNVQVMNFLGVPGQLSRVPYKLNNVTIIEDSLPLLINGFAELSDNDEKSYNMNVYGSEKTFFEKLKTHTLQDVYGQRNIVWTAESLVPYINGAGMNGITLPVAQYNANTTHSGSLQSLGTVFTRTLVTQTSPHFYVRFLFEKIFTHLGYTVTYPFIYDAVFNRLVIPSAKGVSHFQVGYGDTFNVQLCLPEVSCDVLVKELMYRYGLVIKVNEFDKKVTFTKLDTLLKSGPVLDWTDKFSGLKNEKYNIDGYGQTNYLRYKEDVMDENYPTLGPADALMGLFKIDNETLNKEKTIIDSAFVKPPLCRVIESNDWAKGRIFLHTTGTDSFLLDIAENTLESGAELRPREIPFQIQYLKNLSGVVQFRLERPNGTYTTTNVNNPLVGSTNNLSFQTFLNTNYGQIINLLQTMHVIKCTMKLSLLDVYNFDFHSRIYLEQFGSYFYVNKISSYQKNKLVEVELVKIPPIVQTGGGSYQYGTLNMIGTL